VSYRLLDWAMGVTGLSPAHKLLLVALAHCCNGKAGAATCWPSQAKLCELTGLSERAVRYGLRELEARHLIATKPGRGRTSTRYRLACQDSPNGRLDLPEPMRETAAAPGPGRTPAQSAALVPAPRATPEVPEAANPEAQLLPLPDRAEGQQMPLPDGAEGQQMPLSGAPGAAQRGSICPTAGHQMPPEQGMEQGREQGAQREPSDPGARAPAPGQSAGAALSQPPGPRWRTIAAEVRPDLADPAAVRRKFDAYHRGATFATQADADRAWELWLLRERKNCFERYTELHEAADAPGAFLARLRAPRHDDLTAEYQVMRDD
jgi:hypothetical protein